MGYTSYFEQSRKFTLTEWNNITKAVKPLIEGNLILAGSDGTGEPVVSETEICFNGRANADDDSHETFCVTKARNPEFNFCKTAQKPYDAYVVAVLALCDLYAPGALDISSDGSAGDWQFGLSLAQKVDPKAKLPKNIR